MVPLRGEDMVCREKVPDLRRYSQALVAAALGFEPLHLAYPPTIGDFPPSLGVVAEWLKAPVC
jgi:hypothetical protein